MNIVVLGDGLLGSEIVKQTGWDYISRKKDGFDITQSDKYHQYFINDYEGVAFTNKYDCILNCIAYTDTYSKEKQKHLDVNYKSVIKLVNFCNLWNIKLIHISTGYVYTNSHSNVNENDVPIHGDNFYSYSKLLADAYIESESKNYLICRCIHKPRPFSYHKAWFDHFGNFDYVDVIANLIINIIKLDASGIYNVGTEFKSMFQLAKETKPDIESVCKPYWVPNSTGMDVSKMKELLYENNISYIRLRF